MPIPYSSQDLSRIFDARMLTRGRTLGLAGGVEVRLEGDSITGTVRHGADVHLIRVTPARLGRRVMFDSNCSCGGTGCAHPAAASFAALDRFAALRRAEQQSFLDTLTEVAPEPERQHIAFELSPAEPPHACFVTAMQVGARSFATTPITLRHVAGEEAAGPKVRAVARLLGAGDVARAAVSPDAVADVPAAALSVVSKRSKRSMRSPA